jgi:hypothetical protein
MGACTDLSGLGYGRMAACFECGNEPSGSINAGNLLTS